MFNQESSGCFCLNICSQWLDFKNRSIEKIKAIFIFKKTNKTFFALLIISKKNEDIAISNTGLAVILLSVWRCIVFLLAFLGIFWSKKWGYSTQKFFFNILFWTTYKTFHALFKKEKLLLICIRSSPHELCVYTQKMMILCKCVNNKNCCFMNKVECDYIFV